MKFTRLLCNGMEQPLGYDFHHPCLTWVVDSLTVTMVRSLTAWR